MGTTIDLGGHALGVGEGSSRFASLDLRGGGRLDVGGPLAVTGSISVASATTLGTAGATTWSAGSVTLGGTWENTGALAITGGTLSTAVQPGGGLANLAGGTIERHTGSGVVSITVPFTDLATASPSITVRSGTLALTGGTPGGLASHVRLEAGGTLRVTGSQAPTLLAGAAVEGPGTLELAGGATLAVPVGATLDVGTISFAGGTLDLAANAAAGRITSTTGTRRGAGALVVGTGTSDATNLTLAAGSTTVRGPLAIDGALTLSAPATLRLEGATTWSAGNLSLAGSVQNAGALAVTCSTCVVPAGGGSLAILAGGSLERHGSGSATIGVPIANAGTLSVSTGTLAAPAGIDQSGGATSVAPAATLQSGLALGGGTLGGGGSVVGAVTNGGGSVDPAGTLRVTTYAQGPGGTLHVDVAWPAADRLAVTGAATLGGTLALDTATAPPAGTKFSILTAGSTSGAFAYLDGGALPDGSTYTLSTTATAASVTLVAPPPPPPPPPVDPADPGAGGGDPTDSGRRRQRPDGRPCDGRRQHAGRRRHGDDDRRRDEHRPRSRPAGAASGQGAAHRRAPQGPHGGDHPLVPARDGGLPGQRDAASGGRPAPRPPHVRAEGGQAHHAEGAPEGRAEGRAAGDGGAGALRSGPCVQARASLE